MAVWSQQGYTSSGQQATIGVNQMYISPVSIPLMQSQVLGSLTNPAVGSKSDDSWASVFSLLLSSSAKTDPLSLGQFAPSPLTLLGNNSHINQSSHINNLSSAGRNMALFDPESAYRMMSVINNDDVLYKAQFSELSQMKSSVFHMQDASQSLGSIALSTGNDSIKSRLQSFVNEYNNWIQQFNPDVQQGGLLADTQAAQASRFELEQNVNNRFFGVKEGVHGLSELGITIAADTHLASLDAAKLESLLASNKQGVVDAVQDFSANFSKSASLLNSEGNFILKQLDNLNRAIHFISDNKDSLQQEFGTGNAAKPTGQVAQALAVYNQTHPA